MVRLLRSAPFLAAAASALLALTALVAGCDPVTLTNGQKAMAAQGPIDGYFTLNSWTCGSTDLLSYTQNLLGFQKVTLGFGAQNSSFLLVFASGCGNNLAYSAFYDPKASTVTTVDLARSCDIDCGPAQCLPQPAPTPQQTETYVYALNGVNLTLTRTLTSDDIPDGSTYLAAGCASGQTETRTATLQ